jgi:hypothetical protein
MDEELAAHLNHIANLVTKLESRITAHERRCPPLPTNNFPWTVVASLMAVIFSSLIAVTGYFGAQLYRDLRESDRISQQERLANHQAINELENKRLARALIYKENFDLLRHRIENLEANKK